MLENPNLAKTVTFEDFLEMKQGQMKAVIREIRVIMGVLALTIALGGKSDEDDEPRYMENWLSRTLYKALTKGQSELTIRINLYVEPTRILEYSKKSIANNSLLTNSISPVKKYNR